MGHLFLRLLPRTCHFMPLARKCWCTKSSLRVNCLLTVMLTTAPALFLTWYALLIPSSCAQGKAYSPTEMHMPFHEVSPQSFFFLSTESNGTRQRSLAFSEVQKWPKFNSLAFQCQVEVRVWLSFISNVPSQWSCCLLVVPTTLLETSHYLPLDYESPSKPLISPGHVVTWNIL